MIGVGCIQRENPDFIAQRIGQPAAVGRKRSPRQIAALVEDPLRLSEPIGPRPPDAAVDMFAIGRPNRTAITGFSLVFKRELLSAELESGVRLCDFLARVEALLGNLAALSKCFQQVKSYAVDLAISVNNPSAWIRVPGGIVVTPLTPLNEPYKLTLACRYAASATCGSSVAISMKTRLTSLF
jgi:hypothetical protein